MRTGLTPAVNALGLILIAVTIAGAVAHEVLRRREAAKEKQAMAAAAADNEGDRAMALPAPASA